MFSCRHRGETATQDFIFLSPAHWRYDASLFLFLLANLAIRVPPKHMFLARLEVNLFLFRQFGEISPLMNALTQSPGPKPKQRRIVRPNRSKSRADEHKVVLVPHSSGVTHVTGESALALT
jgi:hypothetical protein